MQAASSALSHQAPQGMCAPLGEIDPPAGVTDPPHSVMARPAEVGEPPHETTDPPQDMIDAPAEVTDPPYSMTDPPAEVGEPPQDVTDPLHDMTDAARKKATAQQPALGTDMIGAVHIPESPRANQESLHPAVVQQAKPKLVVPIFRRRTHALPISTNPQGLTHLGQWVDSASPEGPVNLRPTSHDAVEDMIEEADFDKGNNFCYSSWMHQIWRC